ncbi:MAG: hypothetical protein WA941_18495 [Nitrososphaeraceae archaeon]
MSGRKGRNPFSLLVTISSNKLYLAFFVALLSFMFIDILSIRLSNLTVSPEQTEWKLYNYILISCVCLLGQYAILRYVRHGPQQIESSKVLNLRALLKIAIITQLVLSAIILLVMVQVFQFHYYNTIFLTFAVNISYWVGITMLSILAIRLFSWFLAYRSIVIILYAIASSAICLNLILTNLFFNTITHHEVIRDFIGNSTIVIPVGTITDFLFTLVFYSSIISFIFTWTATAALLSYNSKKISRTGYWTVMSLPLVYFLVQFFPFFTDAILFVLYENPLLYSILLTTIFTMSKPIGGILFGIALYVTARKMNYKLKRNMSIAGLGLVILFSSNQANLFVYRTFPPFGLATVSFVSLSSFLVLIGIYSSAISVAQDRTLSGSIKGRIEEQTRLLAGIGKAHEIQLLTNRALTVLREQKENMEKDSGLESSLTDEELKSHINMVIDEIQRVRETKPPHDDNKGNTD